jgi:hypothetical protein
MTTQQSCKILPLLGCLMAALFFRQLGSAARPAERHGRRVATSR